MIGHRSTVGSKADCRSRGHKLDPGPVEYFRADIDHEIIS